MEKNDMPEASSSHSIPMPICTFRQKGAMKKAKAMHTDEHIRTMLVFEKSDGQIQLYDSGGDHKSFIRKLQTSYLNSELIIYSDAAFEEYNKKFTDLNSAEKQKRGRKPGSKVQQKPKQKQKELPVFNLADETEFAMLEPLQEVSEQVSIETTAKGTRKKKQIPKSVPLPPEQCIPEAEDYYEKVLVPDEY